jgi:hypothetical protein
VSNNLDLICFGGFSKFFPLQKDLTRVISILICCRGPETDMSRPGIEPGPPVVRDTVEKSHPDNLLIVIRNIYIWARDTLIFKNFNNKRSTNWCAPKCLKFLKGLKREFEMRKSETAVTVATQNGTAKLRPEECVGAQSLSFGWEGYGNKHWTGG